MTNITGSILVGTENRAGGPTFQAFDASTGRSLEPVFHEAGDADVADACRLAADAFPVFNELAPELRARFIDTVAGQVAALGESVVLRAMQESGLPRARLEGELARTVGQLKLFAGVVREGGWMDVVVDHAMPDRKPLARPDLRRCNVAIGPVAVFGASNFPLAFSVAGGDTASAFAAGCPVVFKGHPAHPGTGELVALAVRRAVVECGLPPGVFSYLPGVGQRLGSSLVADRHIKAVGFTGSRAGGLALMKIAAARAEPIPVHAEMSSVNPVILFPGAAKRRGIELANAYVASLTLGAGQFCTNPGLLIALDDGLDGFLVHAGAALAATAAQPMLTTPIHASFQAGVEALTGKGTVKVVARGRDTEDVNRGRGALFLTEADAFRDDPALGHEIFGAASLVVRARDVDDMARVLGDLEGQLTATLLFDEDDLESVARLMPLLSQKVGRILANGWPTGVEVSDAMVHGGPFPATSDSRTTSVGSLAIQRFLRPVCYQGIPEPLLPPALRDDNPYRVMRRIDGLVTAPPLGAA